MQQIYPVCEESCKPHIGKTVCAVLQDGRYYVGTITGVSDKGVELNGGYASDANVLSTQPAKAKKQLQHMKSKTKAQAKTKAFGYGPGYPGPGYGYGYDYGLGLDWAAIALLFLIPFLFI
ncbi:hypothetical protein [Paenibacillus macerans]|uniref:hypothetical protein n=1 Tax=Paenibacillus macerans TaxID=44252 RepID=UPI003D318E8D